MKPLTVELPLAGEWFIGADGREPGHELALDFMRLDDRLKASTYPAWRELLTAVPLEAHHGWGQPLLSPFRGCVVTAVDGCEEIARSYLGTVAARLRSALSRRERAELAALQAAGDGDVSRFAGNHVVIESAEHPGVYAFLAHARRGSVRVRPGEAVDAGDTVAQLGHSGESMLPHLHFHLMDGPSPLRARPLPFTFRCYELRTRAGWVRQRNSLPLRRQTIRRCDC